MKQNWMTKTVIVVASLGMTYSSFAQGKATLHNGYYGPMIATQPGQYEMIDRAQIEKYRLDWSTLVQKQDQEAYQKATDEAEAAYKQMYGSCTGSDYTTCTGLQQLRQIHIDTMVSKTKMIPAGDLASIVTNFKAVRDRFQMKLGAMSVLSDVWTNLGQQTDLDSKNQKAVYVYQKGSLNLKALTEKYQQGIQQMIAEANKLTYWVDANGRQVKTNEGMGLEEVATDDTPEIFKDQLDNFQKRAALTSENREALKEVPVAFARILDKFVNATDIHLYWYNTLQDQDRKDWIDSLETKARVFKYVKAVYCTPMGVPALAVPAPHKFNIDYLKRGGAGLVRIAQASETDEANIRDTLIAFDQAFLSVRSQSGEFNNVGGVMGYINRANSTLTWHNEVAAYLSVMNILRDMYQDELDLLKDSVGGCEKVRARYNQRYGSLRDESFKSIVETYIGGGSVQQDDTMLAFADAGKVILTRIQYMRKHQLFLAEHPGASLLGQMLDADPTLQ